MVSESTQVQTSSTPGAIIALYPFVLALVLALFAYMGTELLGVTVGEAKNPRKTVPSAIKKTFVSRPHSFG